ncbi:cell pole-organizing protein PopZ [Ancylobacter aquaticus]|uniref:Cell pole-organizing protein PopZ n=1 Tax=Ancylobacter aquaticus TaxID=100 RepID=A0A4R1I1B5_ANCAQ|nr:DUF2497 domain-containing protein [Ancylobacter aquaticus]TCK28538.1 cell pole-organizing protein PopZ [Ancylobacter aquaticus]
MEEILASIRRIISDEVAADPAATRSDAPRPAREAPASRDVAPVREPAPRPVAAAPQRAMASTASSEALSYAPPPYRERVENPVDYAPRGRAPATDPFTPRPVTVSASVLAAAPFSTPSVATRAPAGAVYSGGSAARALEVPLPARPASESRAPEPRRVEPRLFPDSRPMPDLRPLSEARPRPEPRLVEPRSPAPDSLPEIRASAPNAPAPSAPASTASAPIAPAPSAPARPALGASLYPPRGGIDGGTRMSGLPPVRPSFSRPSVVKPLAPLDSDLDKPLAAALLDLALVEQAVQAELANVAMNEPAVSGPVTAESAATVPESAEPSGTDVSTAEVRTVQSEPAKADPVVSPAPASPTAIVAPAPGREALPVAEPTEMPAPAARTSHFEPTREGAVFVVPVKDETSSAVPPVAPASRPDFRATETRPSEARPMEPRSSEVRGHEANLAEARLAETRLSESRLVASNRQGATDQSEPARERLVSAPASSAVSAAFGSLQRTMSAAPHRSVDDLVTDALRPMLKAWLDENLPALVERLVRAEIERVARHGQ